VDVDAVADVVPAVESFRPMPLLRLACPSIVVASDDDIYTSINRAEAFARAWGSRFVRLLRAGHINSASGHGDWPEGRAWLEELVRGAPGGR